MPVAGHPLKCYVKSTNAAAVAGDEVGGLNSVSSDIEPNMLDTTNFKDTSEARTRIRGLLDSQFQLEGDYEGADAPQQLLRASMLSGASVWVTLEVDPTASAGQRGFKVECKVGPSSFGAAVDGKATYRATLMGTGAVAAV